METTETHEQGKRKKQMEDNPKTRTRKMTQSDLDLARVAGVCGCLWFESGSSIFFGFVTSLGEKIRKRREEPF